MSLSDVTRDEVRKQLEIMGYAQISDDLIDEFLHELKKSEQSTNSTFQTSQQYATHEESSRTSAIIYSDDDTDEQSSRATSFVVPPRKPYEPPTLPSRAQKHHAPSVPLSDDDTSALVDTDLESENAPPHHHSIVPRGGKENMLAHAARRSTSSRYPTKQSHQANSRRLPLRPQSAAQKRPSSARGRTAPLGTSSIRPQSASRRRTSLTPSTLVPPPRTAAYRKKVNDPVKRYQQLQRTWHHDRFLNSRKHNHKSLRLQVRKEMREISGQAESYGYLHNF
mmetsp:Transcript_11314/g.42413  ORF Transcript_11314/g.42413 Transcript_11314/m.42413 type:complete len:280 (-) Transcript_11314:1533-2372(-)